MKTGELPHEFLLRVARGEMIDGHAPEFLQRVDAAKAAAPYYAPRLSATAIDANITAKKKTAQEMTDEELMECIADLREKAAAEGQCGD